MSDGTKTELAASEYTVDSSKYNKKKAGSYAITIKLNSDATKTCTYTAVVYDAVGLTLADNARTTFINGEYYSKAAYEVGLCIENSDGTKELITEDNVDSFYIVLDTMPDGSKVMRAYASVDGKELIYEYAVTIVEENTLTFDKVVVTKQPTKTKYTMDEKTSVSFDGQVAVRYKELGDANVYFSSVVKDPVAITSAREAGTYNYIFTVNGHTGSIPYELVDVSDYTLSALVLKDKGDFPTTYYKGMNSPNSNVIRMLDVYRKYTKDGAEDILIQENHLDNSDVTLDTSTVGDKTLKITMTYPGPIELSLDIPVKVVEAIKPEVGTYYQKYSGSDYIYKEYVVVNEDGTVTMDGKNYTITGLKYENYGTLQLKYILKTTTDESETLRVNLDDLSIVGPNIYKSSSTDVAVGVEASGSTAYLIAENGKLSSEQWDFIEPYGEPHLNTADGEVITSDKVFAKGDKIIAVFKPKSGEGQPFLGTFSGSGTALEVTASNITIPGFLVL